MKLDSTAAAYGLIQVVFADVTDRLATAVFMLRQRRDSNVTFEETFAPGFKKILKAFKAELKQFDMQESMAGDIDALRDVCSQLATLSIWRNDRIHARVRQIDEGLALYDWRTSKRLSISYEECDKIIHDLTKVLVTLEAYIPALVGSLDFDREFDAFFKGLEETNNDASE
jgi:hypothetical protein